MIAGCSLSQRRGHPPALPHQTSSSAVYSTGGGDGPRIASAPAILRTAGRVGAESSPGRRRSTLFSPSCCLVSNFMEGWRKVIAFFPTCCSYPYGFLNGKHLLVCHHSPLVPQGIECFLAQLALYLLSELLIGALHDCWHGSIESLA